MEMYELLLERVVTLTNEYFKLKEELKELKNIAEKKKNDSRGRIIHMKIEKKE